MTAFALRRRLTGAVLAVLLQTLLITALLLALRPMATPERLVHELTLILPRLQKAPPPPVTRARSSSPSPAIPTPAIPPIAPPMTIIPIPFTPTPEQLQGLGQSLFGCAPETWSSLTPEQRAHCSRPGGGAARDLLGKPDPVQDEAHWEAELVRKNSPPPALPCTHTKNADLGHGVKVPMISFDMTTCGHTPPDPQKWNPLN